MNKLQLRTAIKLAKVIDTLHDIYEDYDIYDKHEVNAKGRHKDRLDDLILKTYLAIETIVLPRKWVVKGHKTTEFSVSEYDLDEFFESRPDSAKTIAFLKELYENQEQTVHEYDD